MKLLQNNSKQGNNADTSGKLSQIEVSKQTSLNYDLRAKNWQKDSSSRPTVRKWYLKKLGNIKGKYVLDAGCGVGIDTLTLAKNGAKGVGLDFSEKSIDEAKKLMKDFSDRNFVNEDLMKYNTENKFDVILFSMAIMHHKDLYSIMKKFSSLLKNGGILLIVTNNSELVCKDYGLEMPGIGESIQYTHFLGENRDIGFIKFVHSNEDFKEQAFRCGLKLIEYDEITVYGNETAFFNDKNTTNTSIPNFVSFLFKKE